MKGILLGSLTGQLKKVSAAHAECPAAAIKHPLKKLGSLPPDHLCADGKEFSFLTDYNKIPMGGLVKFSFDEICKMMYSRSSTMHETVEDIFETNTEYEIVHKIQSSMWRWSRSKGTWNEIVDAHQYLRSFVFTDDPNFEIRLDHSTYHNPFGYSKYSRIFIDGTFAFLVYYKQNHVLTIGFSLLAGKKILLQQVQSSKRVGNRWLYRLPPNRLEFILELFQKNFPGYTLHVIDARSLVRKTLSDYQRALLNAQQWYREYLSSNRNKDRLHEYAQECQDLKERIRHLKKDAVRLDSFYRNTGRFTLGPATCTANNLLRHCVNG